MKGSQKDPSAKNHGDRARFDVPASPPSPLLRVRNLRVTIDRQEIIRGVNIDLERGQIMGIVGQSGTGKSVLMRTILGLIERLDGRIEIMGDDFTDRPIIDRPRTQQLCGVLFQHGALFSALTVLENVELPLRAHSKMSPDLRVRLARQKLRQVHFPENQITKMPSALSGGMIKRVALARALILDPPLLFLDEPTSGLDAAAAAAFDALVLELRDRLELTVFMVTHDLDSLRAICDQVAIMQEGRFEYFGPTDDIASSGRPWSEGYFSNARARARFGG